MNLLITIEIDLQDFDYAIFETEKHFVLAINPNISAENKINLKKTIDLIYGAVLLKSGYC